MMMRRLSLKLFNSNDMKYIISIRFGGMRAMNSSNTKVAPPPPAPVVPLPPAPEEIWQEVKVPEGKKYYHK